MNNDTADFNKNIFPRYQTQTSTGITIRINEEYRDLVPPMSKEELELLVSSIKTHGQYKPITINDKGEVLDGHHRLKACELLQKKANFEVKTSDSLLSEKLFVINCNKDRRHLTQFQKIELELKVEAITKEIAKQNSLANLKQNTDSLLSVNRLGRQGVNEDIGKRAKVGHDTVRKVKILLAEASHETLNRLRSGGTTINKSYLQIHKKKKREELLEEARSHPKMDLPEGIKLWLGDFRERSKEIPDESIPLLFTDPPYDKESSLYLYEEVAKVALRVLKPGGSLVLYPSHYFLPNIIIALDRITGLKYNDIACVHYPEGHEVFHDRHVFNDWKPLLWYKKGDKLPEGLAYARNFIESGHPQKDFIDWQQSPDEALYLIEKLTVENEIVFDPMMGSGTTGTAAIKLNRQFIGIEINEDTFKKAEYRISKAVKAAKSDKVSKP